MDILTALSALVTAVQEFWAESFLVALLKFFLVVYTLVLVADVVLLLILRDLPGDLKKSMFGGKKPLMSEARARKRWNEIQKRLEGTPAQYKVAILEADSFASEILSAIGYSGATMQEQLDQAIKSQLETKEELVAAHQMRNRIVHEAELTFTREEAEKWLKHYEDFFYEVELFSA